MNSRSATASYGAKERSFRRSRSAVRTVRTVSYTPVEKALVAIGSWVDTLVHQPLILALLLAFTLVLALYTPARACYVAWRVGYDLHIQMDAELLENQELSAEVEHLMTNEGVEDAARARGYVTADETGTVMVVGMPAETSSTEIASVEAEELPWYVAPLDLIFHYDN